MLITATAFNGTFVANYGVSVEICIHKVFPMFDLFLYLLGSYLDYVIFSFNQS